jgi:hypothetical protein
MKSKSITRNEKTEVLATVTYLHFCYKGSYVTRVSLCTEWNSEFKKHFSKLLVATKLTLKKTKQMRNEADPNTQHLSSRRLLRAMLF